MNPPTETECRQLAEAFPEGFGWHHHQRVLRFQLGSSLVKINAEGSDAFVLCSMRSGSYPISLELGLAALVAKCREVADGDPHLSYGPLGWYMTEVEIDGVPMGTRTGDLYDTPWGALLSSVEKT